VVVHFLDLSFALEEILIAHKIAKLTFFFLQARVRGHLRNEDAVDGDSKSNEVGDCDPIICLQQVPRLVHQILLSLFNLVDVAKLDHYLQEAQVSHERVRLNIKANTFAQLLDVVLDFACKNKLRAGQICLGFLLLDELLTLTCFDLVKTDEVVKVKVIHDLLLASMCYQPAAIKRSWGNYVGVQASIRFVLVRGVHVS